MQELVTYFSEVRNFAWYFF